MKIGDKVTVEPKNYFDGTPNPKWPMPHYVGIIKGLTNIRGIDYAKVAYGPRIEFENIDKLQKVA